MNVQTSFGASRPLQFGESPNQRLSRLVELRCQEYFNRPQVKRQSQDQDGDTVTLSN